MRRKIALIFIFGFLFIQEHSSVQAELVENKSLKVNIVIDSIGKPTIGTIEIDNSYPFDYKLNLLHDFYSINLLDEIGNEIFSGKVLNKDFVFPSLIQGDEFPSQPLEALIKPVSQLDLLLPYDDKARILQIFDEDSNLLLSTNIPEFIVTNKEEILGEQDKRIVSDKNIFFEISNALLQGLQRFFSL